GHVRPEGGELRRLRGGRPAAAGRAGPAGRAARLGGVLHLPAANGGPQRQAGAAPGPVPGAGVRPHAGAGRAAPTAPPPTGVVMKVGVRLFARARELAGSGEVSVALPEGATARQLRHELARQFPALARLLERSALAVNEEFASDATVLDEAHEVALLPP